MKILLILVFCLSCLVCFSQSPTRIANKALHFQLAETTDTIDFVVVDTVLTEKKPIFLFCQGSLPVPLFVKFKDYGLQMIGGGVSNFDLSEIRKHYHFVVISMPKTPLIVAQSQVDRSYAYVPDSTKPRQYSKAYIAADYSENYVRRAEKALDFVLKQTWANQDKLVVAGHSQGTKIATKLAVKYPGITHIGLFAPNPFGRIDQFVRQARLDAQTEKKTWEEADAEMENTYDFFRNAHNPDSLKAHPELRAWKSFSQPLYKDWLELNLPIYLAYGTEDRVSDLCDLLPLFFIQEGKDHLTLKRYLRYEHNFFEVVEGKTDYEKANWPEVMHAFVEWTLAE